MAFVNTGIPSGLPRPADPAQLEMELGRWTQAAVQMADRALGQAMLVAAATASTRARLEAIFGNSPFLTRLALREPEVVIAVLHTSPQESFAQVIRSLNLDRTTEAGNTVAGRAGDTIEVARRLRVAKRHAALIIAMADLADLWSLEQVTDALSEFAEATLQIALDHLVAAAVAAGQLAPSGDGPKGDRAGIVILGMGKLGAHELNYSSDIDLMILFDADRLRYVGRDTSQSFMARLARDLVRLMEERTADGYVFRTDLRLRPDPASTPPAVSIAAAETYYGSMGQNWERAAMIKARPVAGDLAAGRDFLASLIPFIWRKHLDFAAIQDIHSIKRQIDARHGGSLAHLAGHNIKLGRGGIREIEFFVQTQQLIWGGRIPALRTSGTIETLAGLAKAGRIDEAVARDLAAAYTALRRIEHRLQMIDDSQTHSLPADIDGMRRLALFSGYPDTAGLEAALHAELRRVQRHYAELFRDAPSLSGPGSLVFTGRDDDPETLITLHRLGFADPARVSETIRGWHHGRLRATRSTRARELLTELIPVLLTALSGTGNPDFAFARFDEFLGRLAASVQLFSLFQHHAEVLDLLAQILGEAPLLGQQLSRKPELIDAVLATGFFDPLPIATDFSAGALRADLGNALARARDYEDVLDLTRRWATEMRFRVGVQLLEGYLDGAGSGIYLAAVAEVVLQELLPRVTADLARMHGAVPGGEAAILAFGKLGSREMTAASDLDLVLIYNAPPGVEMSGGEKPLAVTTYYARLTQRLINALTALTTEGSLYAVDLRLRPSGNAGPIASSLEGFERYQAESAWTWERMALTRARVVAGDPALTTAVGATIRAALTAPRDKATLLADVADMRRRLAAQHTKPGPLDFKHQRGGLVDIDFIAQYLMLAHASERPDILSLDTATALRRLHQAGFIAASDAQHLEEALAFYQHAHAVMRVTHGAEVDLKPALDTLKRVFRRRRGRTRTRSTPPSLRRFERTAATVLEIYTRLIDFTAAALPLPTTSQGRPSAP